MGKLGVSGCTPWNLQNSEHNSARTRYKVLAKHEKHLQVFPTFWFGIGRTAAQVWTGSNRKPITTGEVHEGCENTEEGTGKLTGIQLGGLYNQGLRRTIASSNSHQLLQIWQSKRLTVQGVYPVQITYSNFFLWTTDTMQSLCSRRKWSAQKNICANAIRA